MYKILISGILLDVAMQVGKIALNSERRDSNEGARKPMEAWVESGQGFITRPDPNLFRFFTPPPP